MKLFSRSRFLAFPSPLPLGFVTATHRFPIIVAKRRVEDRLSFVWRNTFCTSDSLYPLFPGLPSVRVFLEHRCTRCISDYILARTEPFIWHGSFATSETRTRVRSKRSLTVSDFGEGWVGGWCGSVKRFSPGASSNIDCRCDAATRAFEMALLSLCRLEISQLHLPRSRARPAFARERESEPSGTQS